MIYSLRSWLIFLFGVVLIVVSNALASGAMQRDDFRERFEKLSRQSLEMRPRCELFRHEIDRARERFEKGPTEAGAREILKTLGRVPLARDSTYEAYRLFFEQSQASVQDFWTIERIGRLIANCHPLMFYVSAKDLVVETHALKLSDQDRAEMKRVVFRYLSHDVRGFSSLVHSMMGLALLEQMGEAGYFKAWATSGADLREVQEKAKKLRTQIVENRRESLHANEGQKEILEKEEVRFYIAELHQSKAFREDYRRAYLAFEKAETERK